MTAAVAHREEAPAPAPNPIATLVERVIVDPNASIEKLEALLAMQERVRNAEAKAAFDAAVAAAKAEVKPIQKSGRVDYTHNNRQTQFNHETMADIATAVDAALARHGLSYRYRSAQEDGNVVITCILAHRDGYAEETTLRGSPDASGSKNSYQAVGSAVTYLQRYTLKLALGLAAAHDDDGQAAKAMNEAISEEQLAELHTLVDQSGADLPRLLKHFRIAGLSELPSKKFGIAQQMLRQKAREAEARQ
jgi:hypothetical protein